MAPVSDGDTANPNVIAYSSERKYVVKVTQRHPGGSWPWLTRRTREWFGGGYGWGEKR